MLSTNQPKFCWPKIQYYVSLNKPRVTEFGWSNYCSTKYLGKAKMLNKKLPLKYRQIDVRSKFIKQGYVLEGTYDKRYDYKPRFKFCKSTTKEAT